MLLLYTVPTVIVSTTLLFGGNSKNCIFSLVYGIKVVSLYGLGMHAKINSVLCRPHTDDYEERNTYGTHHN
jgi:hypothetical protein